MTFVQTREHGSICNIHLNRPEALNALNGDMIDDVAISVDNFEKNSDLETLVFTGEGKAFCAGGDVKAAYAAGKQDPKIADNYFAREYALNQKLFNLSKTTISIMDGITMGGGVGLANACQIRICTEKTRWAMPETTIGFFPDVGGAYYLSRMNGTNGIYLGLTGQAIANPHDLISNKLATQYIPSESIDSFLKSIQNGNKLEEILSQYCKTPEPKSNIDPISSEIENYFNYNSLEDILKSLCEGNEWAKECYDILQAKSPTSLILAFLHIRKARDEDFNQVIERDLKLAHYAMRSHDFYEGVRALLLDKDKNPQWKPDTLGKLDFQQINTLFT